MSPSFRRDNRFSGSLLDSLVMPIDPADLHLVTFPADVLRAKAKPIQAVTDEVRAVADRMIDLMRQHDGIGLAAPQVGLAWRLFVVDVPPSDDRSASAIGDLPPSASKGPVVYINPKFSGYLGKPEPMEEGCLSLPDIRGDVLRPPILTVTALGRDGKEFTTTASGLLARCWQHEMDHLDGVLIIDRMTQMSRIKNRAAVKDLEADAKPAKKR